MDLDRTQPFEGDYPTAPSTPDTRAAVANQVLLLTQLRDPAFRAGLLTKLRAERRKHPGIDQIAGTGAALHVEGELLIDTAAAGRKAVTDITDAQGLVRVPFTGPLADRVVRLRNRARTPEQLRQIATALRGQNATAALNYVVSNAAVGKGGGTPEPAVGPGPYASYPVPSHSGGFPVGIVDTGISAEVRGDGWLAGVNNPPSEIDGLDVLPPDGRLDLAAGHGTHVAGIVQQVAPGTTIKVFSALATDGVGSDLDVAITMLQAVNAGCRILNLSLGCTVAAGDPPPVAMKAALDLIFAKHPDVLVVAAAGNEGTETRVYPAAWAETVFPGRVVSVAGLTRNLDAASWSSRGSWVSASTIAEGVRSTFVEGLESDALDPDPDPFPKSAWAVWSGTSFAAPQIAGAVARICQLQPGTTPRQAWDRLRLTGTPVPNYGRGFKILP